jgi:hypothetical protein
VAGYNAKSREGGDTASAANPIGKAVSEVLKQSADREGAYPADIVVETYLGHGLPLEIPLAILRDPGYGR